MPQNKYALARYQLIDKLLHKKAYVKTVEMVDFCSEILGCCISQRTIQMDLKAMKEDPFLGYFAPVGYCKKNKAYYYEYADFNISPLSFTNEEIMILEYICEYLKTHSLEDKYYLTYKRCVDKIKILF